MAYGLRLKIEYRDRNDILTAINIYQDGFTGVADVRTANQGIRIEWGDQGGEGMPVIYGSSCTICFDAEFDYEFLYLFSSNAKLHRVDIEKNEAIFWTGFIEPDGWSEPLISPPYAVQCTAYDGLGFLKDTPFLDADGLVYTGKKTIFEILKICLLKTGLDITIHTGIDWQEQLQEAGTDLTKVHKVNCDAFLDLSCYEVLEKLLPECRIFQRSARWWVISNTNFYRYTIDYFTTYPDGSTAIESLVSAADGYWFEDQATMEILPAFKHLNVVQNYGVIENLIINGSFDKFNNGQFEGWIETGVTPRQIDLNKDGDKYVFLWGTYWPEEPITHDTNIAPSRYIAKTLSVKQSTSVFKLSLNYGLIGAEKKACEMFITCKLIGANHSYFIKYKPTELDNEGFEWWIDDGLKYWIIENGIHQPSSLGFISLSAHNKKNFEGNYYKTPDNVSAYGFDKIVDHFESFTAAVEGIPEDGTLELKLYVPYTNEFLILGSAFTGIKLELLTTDEERYPETTAYKITNSVLNNYVPEDAEMLIGDYPDLANSDIMFKGGLSRLDNSHTTGWRQIGTTDYHTYAEFIALIRGAYQKIPRQAYQVRMADMIPTLNMVIWDVNNSDRRLLENGITYDDRMQAVEGRYIELFAINFTGLTVISATEFDSKTGKAKGDTTTKTISANPINAAQRVTLIDSTGAIVSLPGHLYENDFEINEGKNDGFTRLQIKKEAITPYNMNQAAGQLQFSITSIAEANFEGNPNRVKFSAGKFLIHNFNALDKDNRLTAIQL